MKYFLSMYIFLCATCHAYEGDIKAVLIEKKEPANAVCYLKFDPYIRQKTLEIPYAEVAFLFADTDITDKMPNIWIQFEDKKVKHLLFGDKKVDASVLNVKFVEKILKLRDSLEAKI